MTSAESRKRSKTEKLLAVFERVHARLANVKEEHAERLCESWSDAKASYASLSNVPQSTLVAGLEQGLRELPSLLQGLSPTARADASRVLEAALEAEYPEILEEQQDRLVKIMHRGRLRSESEFYLIRHRIDLLEGIRDQSNELDALYALVEQFEAHR